MLTNNCCCAITVISVRSVILLGLRRDNGAVLTGDRGGAIAVICVRGMGGISCNRYLFAMLTDNIGCAVAIIIAGFVSCLGFYHYMSTAGAGHSGEAVAVICACSMRCHARLVTASTFEPVIRFIVIGDVMVVGMFKLGRDDVIANRAFFGLFLGCRAVGDVVVLGIGHGATFIRTYVPVAVRIAVPLARKIVFLCGGGHRSANTAGNSRGAVAVVGIRSVARIARYCGLAAFGAFDFGHAVAVILAGGVSVRRSYGVSARTNVGGGAIIIVVRTVRSYILFISASALVPVVGCILVGNAIFVRMLKLGSNYELANRTFFSLFLGSRAVGNMICFRIGYGASVIFTYVPMSACIICPSFAEIVALCLRNNGRASGTGYGSCAISVICVSNVLSLATR